MRSLPLRRSVAMPRDVSRSRWPASWYGSASWDGATPSVVGLSFRCQGGVGCAGAGAGVPYSLIGIPPPLHAVVGGCLDRWRGRGETQGANEQKQKRIRGEKERQTGGGEDRQTEGQAARGADRQVYGCVRVCALVTCTARPRFRHDPSPAAPAPTVAVEPVPFCRCPPRARPAHRALPPRRSTAPSAAHSR